MIHLADHPDLTKYTSATVYLKDDAVHKVTVTGKIVSVDFDNYRIAITTDTNYAVFNVDDILGISFS